MSTPPGSYDTLDALDAASQPVTALPATPPNSAFTPEGPGYVAQFATAGLQPPAPLYVTQDDLLRVVVLTSNAFLTGIELTGRQLLMDGTIKLIDQTFQPLATNRAPNFFSINLPEGFLLNLEVNGIGANQSARGQTFVQITLTRPTIPTQRDYAMLVCGYQTEGCNPCWPNGQIEAAASGMGYTYTVVGAVPAPGAETIITVPTSARWRVVSGHLALTTSAAAGQRTPDITFTQNGGAGWLSYASAGIGPSTGPLGFNFAPGVPLVQDVHLNFLVPIPFNLMLRGGDTVGTTQSNLQAGDQFTAVTLSVEEWIDGQV